MTQEQDPSLQSIRDCLNTHYGLAITSLQALSIGADLNASLYKAKTREGASYFIKLRCGDFDDMSVTILALLYEAGVEQIIPPIRTIQGELTQHIDGFTLTVYPFVEGKNGFCHNLTDHQWVTLGKVLRRVHEFDVPASIKERIKRESYSSEWREIVRSLESIVNRPVTGDEAAVQLQAFMKKKWSVILHLITRAECLSHKVQAQEPKFVLCHSDIHGGNVLIDGQGAIYILDWDEPIMAPKERDLMFIGGGVANVWNDPREEEFFYRGYGKTEINPVILAYYRHERIVVDRKQQQHCRVHKGTAARHSRG